MSTMNLPNARCAVHCATSFERGRADTFKIKGSDVGNVQKVVIRHDNSGMGPDWHLEQVSMTPSCHYTTFSTRHTEPVRCVLRSSSRP